MYRVTYLQNLLAVLLRQRDQRGPIIDPAYSCNDALGPAIIGCARDQGEGGAPIAHEALDSEAGQRRAAHALAQPARLGRVGQQAPHVRDAPPTRYPAGKRRPRTLRIDQARTGPRGAQSWLPRVAMRSAGTARGQWRRF